MIEIPLHNRCGTVVARTLVDDDDAALAQHRWCLANGYPARFDYSGGRRQFIKLSRKVMGAPIGVAVDHVNGNLLDNRRENLRAASPTQNARNRRMHKNNRSGFKGVDFIARLKRWRASIWDGHRKIMLGTHPSAEQAAAVYDDAAAKLFGDFARLNFPVGVQ